MKDSEKAALQLRGEDRANHSGAVGSGLRRGGEGARGPPAHPLGVEPPPGRQKQCNSAACRCSQRKHQENVGVREREQGRGKAERRSPFASSKQMDTAMPESPARLTH